MSKVHIHDSDHEVHRNLRCRAPDRAGRHAVGRRAELVAAVANAGALGFITALTQPTPADLADETASRCCTRARIVVDAESLITARLTEMVTRSEEPLGRGIRR